MVCLFVRVISHKIPEGLKNIDGFRGAFLVSACEYVLCFLEPNIDLVLLTLSSEPNFEIVETWVQNCESVESMSYDFIEKMISSKCKLIDQDGTIFQLYSKTSFGSGTHPTTLLCIKLLKEVFQENEVKTVLDLGTGSGILALYAARLGAQKVLAVDIDESACQEAYLNVIKNNYQNKILVVQDTHLVAKRGSFELVVSNILKDTLIQIIPQFTYILKPNGLAIVSGFTESQMDAIEFYDMGFSILSLKREAGWSAALLKRAY